MTSHGASQTLLHRLPNGLQIVAEPLASKSAAAFNFLIPAGSANEPAGQDGITNVLEGLCYRGAGHRNARELSDALDDLGVDRGGGADTEYTTFGGATLGLYLPDTLRVYADIIRQPQLPADDWEPQRALALQALQGLEDSPARKMFVHLRQNYFLSGHRRSTLGTREGLESLSIEAIRADHARRFVPKGAILALAGDLDWDRTVELVEELFGDWSGEPAPLEAPRVVEEPLWEHLPDEKAQVQIGVVYRGVAPEDPDNYSYRLALAILSGGMGARLFSEVREKRGLVYSVSASASTHRGFGYTVAYAGTTPERAQETLNVLLAELKRMELGVSEDELERARVKTLTSLVMGEESSRARAASLARDLWMLGRVRSVDEITRELNAVTPQTIRDFYERHPVRDFSIATLGPKALERPSLLQG